MPQLGYHLRQNETGQLHLIEELEIWGDFAVSQTEIPLILTKLGERVYGTTEASMGLLRCAMLGQAKSLILVGQIARVSSSKAARTRRFTVSSVPSS